ncbi:MAG: C-terminal binding protein [candidate division Zixibacteria bacterium]|nr:C-terminal binding protein [candidate division Zixibacteria bacterium]
MSTVIVTDHGFPSLDPERSVLEAAGITLEEIRPVCKNEDDIIRTCPNADVLIVQWAPVNRRVFEALPKVRCIVRYGVGVDNFDLKAAKDLGIVAANVPDYCVEEVSNHALSMILSLCRRIPHDHSQMAAGGWGVGPFRPMPALSDLTLGVVSFGRIARRVMEKAAVFGFDRIACDPFLPDAVFEGTGVRRVDLETLLCTADVISLHCPLVRETRHLINRDTLAQMKPGAILVNTSRGPVVCEADLIDALGSGHLSGAGLDVFEKEPLPTDSPLHTLSNVILTSHAASVSERSVLMLQTKAAEIARDFLQGKRPYSALT